MTDDERARFIAFIDSLDATVAGRPDILASPTGFVLGALVGAGRSNPDDAWTQVAGLADVLAYLVMHVREGTGDPETVIASIIPAA